MNDITKESNREMGKALKEIFDALREVDKVKSEAHLARILRVNTSHFHEMIDGKRSISNRVLKILHQTFNVDLNYLTTGGQYGAAFLLPPSATYAREITGLKDSIQLLTDENHRLKEILHDDQISMKQTLEKIDELRKQISYQQKLIDLLEAKSPNVKAAG
ncbi:hypothetical protein [Chitinophaga rhizosphaerae]|uniref:hypothetical protein n=1 Tax=Chitinophaga rhizosphaerae TaxID=1864947 RepID=UPI000F8079D9|nr:hypothetical protein [Chitinophaga rhizosphaerae]